MVDDGGTMGDDEDGLAPVETACEVVEQALLCVGVEGAGCLVEEQYAAFAQQGAGYGDALGLSLAESGAEFAAQGVEPVGLLQDEVGTGALQGARHLLFGGIGVAEEEVVAHGAAEKGVALGDVDQVAASEWTCRCPLDVRVGRGAVELHGAALWLHECQDESEEGGLTGACLAQNGGCGAWHEVVAEVGEDSTMAGVVGVADVVDTYADGGVEAYGLALFLEGCLLELDESLAGGKAVDDDGYEACHLAYGPLYLSDELDEGYHHAIGDGAVLQSADAPQEGDEVAGVETGVHEGVGDGSEDGATSYLAPQSFLQGGQTAGHGVGALEGFEHRVVLYALGEQTLYLAVSLSNLSCYAAHLFYVDATEECKDGGDDDDDESQAVVHGIEVEEGCDEAHEDGHGCGDGLGDDVGDVGNVAFKSVECVAAMSLAHALPFAVEQALEEFVLHAVLRLDAQEGAYPLLAKTDGYLREDDADEHGSDELQGALLGAHGGVDGHLGGCDEGKVEPDAKDVESGIQAGLKAERLGGLP